MIPAATLPPGRSGRIRSPLTLAPALALALATGSLAGCSNGGGGNNNGGGGGGGTADGTAASVKLPTPSPAATLFGQVRFKSAAAVTGLVSGDFDADGHPDVAATGLDGDVWFHMNDGTGDLRAKRKMRYANTTSSPAVADFDLDGDDDLVVLQRNQNRVRVLRSQGNGSFKNLTLVPTLGSPRSVTLQDLTGDGLPELVVNAAQNLGVHINLGNGAFDTMLTSNLASTPVPNVLFDDVTGDGVDELVYATDTQLIVKSSLGNGNFVTLISSPGNFGGSLVLLDVDGDGVLDALTGDCDEGIGWYIGQGDGSFVPAGSQPMEGCRNSTASVDLDGDGQVEVVVANQAEVTVFMGSPTGPQPGVAYPVGQSRGLAVEDFDGDGLRDVLVGNWPGSELRLLLGRGDGSVDAPLYVAMNGVPKVSVGDLDGDLVLDIVSTPRDLLRGVGDGSFAPLELLPVAIGGRVTFTELNQDFVPDLVGSSATVYLGDGFGSIGNPTTYASAYAEMVALADLDGDFLLDVVAPLRAVDQVAVLFGNGDGSFANETTYSTGIQPSVAALGDLNGDAQPDLAVANRKTDDVTILLGAADGSFHSPGSFETGRDPQDLILADINADGRNDLVVAATGTTVFPGGVELYLGRGDGSFDPARQLGGLAPVQVRAADFDGDGLLDLAVADSNVIVLLNRGGGKFHTPAGFNIGAASASSIAIGDLDGDGRPDIAAGNQDERLTVLINRGLTP